jgi:hypothetical protein
VPQAPLNTWKYISVLVPTTATTLERSILASVDAATKENHTSSSGLPKQGAAANDKVALTVVPAVLVQVAACVMAIAPEQLSFDGACAKLYPAEKRKMKVSDAINLHRSKIEVFRFIKVRSISELD